MPTTNQFLRDFDVELGKLDTGSGPSVNRDSDGRVAIQGQPGQDNIQTYRDFGIDAIIEAAAELNTTYIEDGQGNVFGDSLYKPTVDAYYALLPPIFGPQVSEIFIRNSRGVDECLQGNPSDRDISDCYVRRTFDSIVSAGLIQTFPLFTSPLGGGPIPIFNIMPSNMPSNFSTVFVSSVVPLSGSSVFSDVSLLLDKNFNKENQFVSTIPASQLTQSEKETLEGIFEPKDADIDLEYTTETLDPSGSALIFEADLNNTQAAEFDVNVSFGPFSETLRATEGEDFYRTSPSSAVFKLGVYVAEEPVTISGPQISNVQNKRIYNGAPFFEESGTWFFVSNQPTPEDLQRVNIKSAQIFDPPEFDISNIQDKVFNRQYSGFGATRFIEGSGSTPVPEGQSVLEDFFNFYADYVEQNFAVVHIGLSTSSPPTPIVSQPEQVTVTLD